MWIATAVWDLITRAMEREWPSQPKVHVFSGVNEWDNSSPGWNVYCHYPMACSEFRKDGDGAYVCLEEHGYIACHWTWVQSGDMQADHAAALADALAHLASEHGGTS